MLKLANRNGIKIPYANVDEIKAAYNFNNLESFLKIFYQGSQVLIKEQDFFDLTWAYALKCKEDNVVHTEIFFHHQPHVNRGKNFDIINVKEKSSKLYFKRPKNGYSNYTSQLGGC